VVQRIPQDQRGVAVRDVPMLQGTTAYEVLGDWPGWLSLAAAGAVLLWKRRG
jgi:apolipoprotein N-acyltransferase